jgi:hypothetical protein
MFALDLFKSSIRLEEDILVPKLEISQDKGSPIPAPGTPPGKEGPIQTSELNPGVLAGPIEPNLEAEGEIAAIDRPPNPEADQQKPISEYLMLGMIPNDETETRHLTCQAKRYLIHNDELYCCNTSCVLQRCILPEEGKALLFDFHEGVWEHDASSRSMVGKAFRQGFYWPMAASDTT